MIKMAVVSGKGGTGKTTLVSGLIELAKNKIIADCDVEAPNLHLLLSGNKISEKDYYGAKEASINPELCSECGKCREVCRFGAISDSTQVLPLYCEGCGACRVVCPEKAVDLKPVITGSLYLDGTEKGIFSHALLQCGAEGSGRLVAAVREEAQKASRDEEWMIIDGAPGIGCVVIASITGCDGLLAVTEPSLSGLHDLDRVLHIAHHFGIPSYVCINKYDINEDLTRKIIEFCQEREVPVVGKIPYDPSVMEALQHRKSFMISGSPAAKAVKDLWEKVSGYYRKEERNMKKVCVAIDGVEVSSHFGQCSGFLIYEIDQGKILDQKLILNPGHVPGFLPDFLSGKGVECLITGGIGMNAKKIFDDKDIKVIYGVKGEAEKVIKDYCEGRLEEGINQCEH